MPKFNPQKKKEVGEKKYADEYQQSRLDWNRQVKANKAEKKKVKAYENAFGRTTK